MKGGTTAVKNTPFKSSRLPLNILQERTRAVIWQVLTPHQRDTLLDYYYHTRTIPEIAAARGVNKSTVCRTLHQAEQNLHRYLQC